MKEIVLSGRGPNTMSLAMLAELDRALEEAGDAPLLVTGAGSAFSAGLDLDELGRATAADVERLLEGIERVARRVFLHPAPTVALVNGHAIAGGCLLVQCCDERIASADPAVRLGMTGVAIGLTYPPFVLSVFAARVPPPHLETVLLGAERHAPDAALRLGLVDELSSTPREIAEARLAARAALPRAGYAATKRALREPAMAAAERASERFRAEVLPAWTAALLPRR